MSEFLTAIASISQRMDNTITDVAQAHKALKWAELLQLIEDVSNHPRDIQYVTKLARSASELKRVFALYQNVLNVLEESNSQLQDLLSNRGE